jgi:hypothetical protein
LQEHIDAKIHNWIESFEHNQLKEKEWIEKADCQVFYDIHHSMKVYSNGAAHALQFLKDELVEK